MEEQNLPDDEMPNYEAPQPEEPQIPDSDQAKKSGKRWLIAGFILVLILVGLYFFVVPMFQDAGVDDSDEPPRASLDQNKYQGAIFNGPMGMLLYEKSDYLSFEEYKKTLSGVQKANPTVIGKNTNYYFSDKDLSFNDITKCIDPKAGQLLVMYYSPGETGIEGENYQKGFYTFPKGPFVDNSSVKFYRAEGQMKIPAGRGFVVISKVKSEAYCFESADKLSSMTPVNTVKLGEKGWTMIAAKNTDVDKSLEKLEPNVRSVWVQEMGKSPTQLKRNADDKYATTLKGSKLLWVKLDGIVKQKTPKVDLGNVKSPELKLEVLDEDINLSWTPLLADVAKNFDGYMAYYMPIDKPVSEDITLEALTTELSKTQPEFYFVKNGKAGSPWMKDLEAAEAKEKAKLEKAGVTDEEMAAAIKKVKKPFYDQVLLPMDEAGITVKNYKSTLVNANQYVFLLVPLSDQNPMTPSFKIFTPVTEESKAVALFGKDYKYEKEYLLSAILKKGVGLTKAPENFKVEEKDGKLQFTWKAQSDVIGYALFDGSKGLTDKSKLGLLVPQELNPEIIAEIDLFIDGKSKSKTLADIYKTILEANKKLITGPKFEISNYKELTEAGKKYEFGLISISKDGSISDISKVDWTAPEEAITLESPKDVAVEVKEGSVAINWSAADKGISPDGYSLVYTPYISGKEFAPTNTGFVELNSKSPVKVTGDGPYKYTLSKTEYFAIKPGTYKVSVFAIIEGEALSEPAISKEFVIAAPEDELSVVTPDYYEVKVGKTDKIISLTWKHDPELSKSPVLGYKVLFTFTKDGETKYLEEEKFEVKEKEEIERVVKMDSKNFSTCMEYDLGTGEGVESICQIAIQALGEKEDGKIVAKPMPKEVYSWGW